MLLFLLGGFEMKHMNSRWIISLAVAGVVAFAACGVADEVAAGKEPANLEQMKQRLYVDLGSNVGEPVTSGNVYNAANEFTPPVSCADGIGGSDLSFKWTAPQSGSYTFSTLGTGSLLDSVLHIYTFSENSATALLGCNDNADAPYPIVSSSVTLMNLAAGAQIRIVVDSYEPPTSRNGAFKLNIVPNFILCPSAPSECRVSPGTWTQNGCVYPPKAAGTQCNDGNACTTSDVCDGAGACGGQPLTCANTANATASSCSAGSCTITACAAGWANCDGVYSNGCETNLNSSDNCGACGSHCGSPNICSGGTCAACAAGWANCDGVSSNGCETNLNSSDNCGACGSHCGWPSSCVGGTCELSCDVCDNGLECCAPKRCGYAPNGSSICK
ncbi:hypothetical protein [Corallococcus exercitus]|uniref:hypothetical protein n=1 Tax=Corallococcus exercitus TaxID=2316736 RepID=UPI0035D3DEB3